MKNLYIFILIGLLFGCTSEKETCKKGLPEKQYDFLADIKRQANFDYLEAIIDFRQFGAYSKNYWIKKPENLKRVYSSLKQIGLKRFISEKEFNTPLFTDHWTETSWANKSLNQITQDLIQSYSDATDVDKYYLEFWNRRKIDQNESVVFQILNDIMNTYNSDSNIDKLNWKFEPKLTELMGFEIRLKESDSISLKRTTIDYYNYLTSIGLYSSANNLIRYQNELLIGEFERQDEDFVKLIVQIETDSVKCEEYWNWRFSADWFTEIYDYGP